jgi:uncharacterized protein involved in exopolysaccharide biosynthesis
LFALAIAFAAGVLLPREYTASARIVIEPPAGSDPRVGTTAISPIYLESLKTYEAFASSDSLFEKAVAHFHLREALGARPIESLKKRVLKAGIVRNTRILEISATLPNPRTAQALAQFVAESTTELNRSLAGQGDSELTQGIAAEDGRARQRLDEANARWAQVQSNEPIVQLQAAMEASSDLRAKLYEQLLGAESEIAGATAREKQATGDELARIREEESETRVRRDELKSEIDGLDRQAAAREKLFGERLGHRDRVDGERKAAQAAFSAVETRLLQANGEAGYRGERLKIIDPGVVPERPSSPNLPLYLFAALIAGLALPVFYFAIEINFQEMRVQSRRGLHSLAHRE